MTIRKPMTKYTMIVCVAGIPTAVISLLRELMNKWKTRLELRKDDVSFLNRVKDIE